MAINARARLVIPVILGAVTLVPAASLAAPSDRTHPEEHAAAVASRWRPASIADRASIAAARIGDALTFSLPEGDVTGEVDRRKEVAAERFVIAGRLQPSGSFAVAVNGDAVYGHVRRPGWPVLAFRTDAESGMVQREAELEAPFCEVESRPFDRGAQAGDASFEQDCGDGSVIDVLAIYTPEAAEEAGGVAELEAAIDLAIEENNIAWANSGLSMVQNLVLTWQVSGSASVDQFIDPADGKLDEVHPLRDAYGGDLVVLVDGGSGGYADGLTSLDPSEEATAFCQAGVQSFDDMVVSHELGHLMGCCHALGDGGGCDVGLLFPFSNGYRFVGDSEIEWRTVMAYVPGTKIMHFSNPEVSFDGHPTGVPQSESDAADNVATIDASALLVSNFRCPGPCDGSDQPSNGPDCNKNGIPDACDLTLGTSFDANGNGAPDECERPCPPGSQLVVSTDPADAPDFPTIQQAVDAAAPPRTCIQVYPGLAGSYPEAVVIDRGLALSIIGVDLGWGPPVLDGSTDPVLDVVSTADTDPVRLKNLTLRSQTGLRTSVSTVLEQLVFEGAPTMSLALDLDGGDSTAAGLKMEATVDDGIDLAEGATLTLENSSLIDLAGTAARVAGEAELTNVLIGGTARGIVMSSTGDLTLHLSEVAAIGMGPGVDNTAGGAVSSSLSILYDNAGGDMVGVPCTSVSNSVVGSPDCSAVNGNTASNPLLQEGYVPGSGSSANDLGPDPSTYTGTPCFDLLGRPRLLDRDGDHLAQADAGPFENDWSPIDAVTNLRWTGNTDMVWDAVPWGVEYHVYRSDSTTLGYDDFGTCIDEMDPDRTDESFVENAVPPSGQTFYYRVTAEGQFGNESSLGLATCVERSRFHVCP